MSLLHLLFLDLCVLYSKLALLSYTWGGCLFANVTDCSQCDHKSKMFENVLPSSFLKTELSWTTYWATCLVKGAMTQLSYYSQFIIVTERMGANMVIHTKKTELSVHISTWNFHLKLLLCSPSIGQWSPFWLINCVILRSVGAPLCHALRNSPKSHQTSCTECSGTQWCRKANIIEFCPLVFHLCDKSSIYQRIDAGTISGWLWRCTCNNEMKHCNHDVFPTPAITSGTCTTKKHGFRDWLLLLRRSHCRGCIVISSPVSVARLLCGWTAI